MRRLGIRLGAALLALATLRAAPFVAGLRRSWPSRVAVAGHSMEPTLRAGDWLLVDPLAYRARPPRPGELVVAPDPHEPSRWLVKRVAEVQADGRLALAGDHPGHTLDDMAPLEPEAVVGRPWLRYWPVRRLARLG